MGPFLSLGIAACGAAPQGVAPSPACDTSGVWRVRWSDTDEPDLEVTFDPALLRVTWNEVPFGHEGVATAVDVRTCRAHVLQRSEVLYGAEGEGDRDVTLRVEFALGRGAQPVTGVIRDDVRGPPSTSERALSGVARRQDGWRR